MDKSRIEILVPCQIFEQKRDASKAIAKLMPTDANFGLVEAQPDLLFMRSVLVSTGGNLNDDVFLPEEMWQARSTPVLKPVDWEHNTGRELTPTEQAENPGKVVIDNQTIGVMYNAYTVDENKEIIDEAKASASDFEIPNKFHIIDEAVIWKALYPSVAKRIEEGAAKGTLFVSMEAWFTDYYYLVGSKVIARNETTAFLDRTLRANGGSGSYAGERVRRALRNITFGGKGIVARPANEPSIITHISHEPISASAGTTNKAIAENIIRDLRNNQASVPRKDIKMPNENKEQQVALELFTKASDESASLRAEVKAKDAELAKANEKVNKLNTEATATVSALAKGSESLDALIPGFSANVTAKPESFFSILSDALTAGQAAQAEVQKQLEESLAKISEIETSARAAARSAKIELLLGLAAMDSDEEKKKAKEKKDKMLAAVKDLSDDQFSALYEVWAEEKAESKKPPFLMTPEEKKKEEEKKKAESKKPPFLMTPEEKKKEEEKKKAESGPGKKMASVEDTVREVLAGLMNGKASASDDSEFDLEALVQSAVSGHTEPSDEDNLMAILSGIASEKTPSAGVEAPQGVDLMDSFAGLVKNMLNYDDNEDK